MLVFTRWYHGGSFTLCIHVMAPDFKSSTQLLIGAAIGTDGKPLPLPSLVAYTVCTQLFGCSPYALAAWPRRRPRRLIFIDAPDSIVGFRLSPVQACYVTPVERNALGEGPDRQVGAMWPALFHTSRCE